MAHRPTSRSNSSKWIASPPLPTSAHAEANPSSKDPAEPGSTDTAWAAPIQLDLESKLHWIRPPRQARTHRSLERLLDVTKNLLLEKCFDDIHIREITLRAETSVAAFYRRFKDKDSLLHALHERHCEESFATADDALALSRWEGADIAEILLSIFSFLIEVMQPDVNMHRAIYQRAISDEIMRERSDKLHRYVMLGLSSLLLARSHEIHHPTPKAAISFALTQATALLTQRYTVGIRDPGLLSMSDETVAVELVMSCLAYLGVSNPKLSINTSTEGDRP